MRVRFLLDEQLDPDLIMAVVRREPQVEILRVGDRGAPSLGTLDQELLLWLEQEGRMLVTMNRRSMPNHLEHHHRAGHHTWGIAFVDSSARYGDVVESILAIWGASDAAEWLNSLLDLPL